MSKTLLIEVGIEELPAIPFLKELPNIEEKWQKILNSYGLDSKAEFYYTPRRVVLFHKEFPLKQKAKEEEFFGAPVEIAFDSLGEPTAAANSFAKKCGVEVGELLRVKKGEKEILYFKKEILGKESKELLPTMLNEWLKSLNFGKSMRWGSLNEAFIRPIRSVFIMQDDKIIPSTIFGVKAKNMTFAHRSHNEKELMFQNSKEYFKKIEEGGIVLNQAKREEKILNQMSELEKKYEIKIEKDRNLLNEIVAITEYPTALHGEFDEKFLQLPPEVIITSMKEHQRYFPVFKDGKLSNHFIFVSNALTKNQDLIISGNERVLRARLEDALFFWENDLAKGLSNEGLKNILYLEGIGSIYDKTLKEQKIAKELSLKYIDPLLKENGEIGQDELLELMQRTVGLCKSDLLSEMVNEFPELQGLMGYYYAKMSNQNPILAKAFKEQYLPDSEDSQLPSSLFSAIVALSNKLDSLFALFSIEKIPTGTKDPFALRRAATGIIKIILSFNLSFDLKKDLKLLSKEYKEFDLIKLENFFIERVYGVLKANPSIINAVLQSGERDLVKIAKKVKALENLSKSEDFKSGFTTFKRVANIVKDINLENLTVNEEFFKEKEEGELLNRLKAHQSTKFSNYEEILNSLFSLKEPIDSFFDSVMVNVEDKKIASNRQNLIASIYKEFLEIADIKMISF